MPNTYTQIASDTFTRANESPLTVSTWTTPTGGHACQVLTNGCTGTLTTNVTGCEFWNAATFPNDQYAQASILRASTSGSVRNGVSLRLNASGQGYAGLMMGTVGSHGTLVISRIDSAGTTGTTLKSVSIGSLSVTVGDIIRLEIVGSTLTLFYRSTAFLTAIDTTYASGSAGVYCTPFGNTNNSAINNWSAGSITSPPLAFSYTDSRIYGNFPNQSRNVNGTLIYDVQTSSNPNVPSIDSRISVPVASGVYPQNSRTPGTYGPGN